MSPRDTHSYAQSIPPPESPGIPLDPSLSLYSPQYSSYQQHTPTHLTPHLSFPNSYSSPSSQGSDTVGTPPIDHMYSSMSNGNGKRPASSISTVNLNDSRKKARTDYDFDEGSPAAEKEEKVKPTRGSRACTVCRRLKMKCVGAEQGPPCKRCQTGNHECIFEESNRGKRSSKKHEILTRSLRKMEKTLDTVLRSIGNPTIASGMISRTPSPTLTSAGTQALLDTSPSPPPMSASSFSHAHRPGSPKLHSLPDNALNPLGLLAEASLANRRAQGGNHPGLARAQPGETPKVGVASHNYFKPGPMTILPLRRLYIERQVQPEMLSFVTTEEVVALFNIYFDNINMHCSLLDRDFHTPSVVCSRSPFLLTTICAIASKFHSEKPELHSRLTELAKKLAFSVPGHGYKSVEIVQAYLLLSLWGCGAVERFEQDKTWMLLGMGIRMATDLNLHRKTAVQSQDTEEGRARDIEVHNRERTWLVCYCLDRSYSAQMGKPHCIKEDFIISNADTWCQGPLANTSDIALTAYVDLQRVMSRSLDFLYSATDNVSGLQSNCDFMTIIKSFESQIMASGKKWRAMHATVPVDDPRAMEYRILLSQLFENYFMLVVNSFGLQNALERSPVDIGYFFARCHTAAMGCVSVVRDHLAPRGFMRYSPDSHCVWTSYAVLSLLKMLRPELSAYAENEQNTFQIVREVADVLEGIAVNPTHTPALYGGFLRVLISKSEGQSTQHPSDTMKSSPQPFQSADDPSLMMNEFQFGSEMGPAIDTNTFPPTMAPLPHTPSNDVGHGITMDSILSTNFWDNVLVPGYNTLDGLSGGFLFGAGGSGLITPRMGATPFHSGQNTPSKEVPSQGELTQVNINAAFENGVGVSV